MQNKGYAFGLCLTSVITIAITASAIGTIEWTVGTIVQQNETIQGICTVTRKLGLISGEDLQSGTNCVVNPSGDIQLYSGELVPVYSLNYATIAFCAVSLLICLIVMGISAYNVCENPYETCCTAYAILIYNVVGLVCALIAVILYTVLLYTESYEPLLDEKPGDSEASGVYRNQGYVMQEDAYFGYSFFLLVVTLFTYMFGILLSILSERSVITNMKKSLFSKKTKQQEEEEEKNTVMMF